MMVLCTGLLVGCDKEPIIPEESVKPPIDQPEKPEQPSEPDEPEEPEEPEKPIEPGELPSTEKIINFNNEFMIVGADKNVWWSGIAYGNGKYVAVGNGVGNSGFITSSTNGENWSTVKTEGMKGWYDIAYGNGKFVVVGSSSGSYATSSTDGENWSNIINFNDNIGLMKIVFGNGKFVVISKSSYVDRSPIISSADGINWNTYSFNIGGDYDTPLDIVYANGIFLIIGSSGNRGFIITSTDGFSWSTPTYNIDSSLLYIAYGNGKFVAGNQKGDISISTDGKSWSSLKRVYDIQISNIVYANGKFVILGTQFNPVYGGFILTSIDGENWSEPIQVSNQPISDICAMP